MQEPLGVTLGALFFLLWTDRSTEIAACFGLWGFLRGMPCPASRARFEETVPSEPPDAMEVVNRHRNDQAELSPPDR